ncbi:MAG: fibronectin type III domain-containing protein, partial [Treponema sp.]|nr:fibronectin type III domain-containing protein [Treponema sp.]
MLAVILVACDNGINGDTTPPGPVTNLDANAGDGQVTLTWNDPTDADLDSIEITWTPGGTTPQVVTKGTKSATIKGLTNGTPYTFTVKAKDNATPPNINQGETITAKPAAQPDTTSPDTQPDTTSPGPVTSLNATVGDKWVTLTWNDPPDADLDSIEITWTPPDGN